MKNKFLSIVTLAAACLVFPMHQSVYAEEEKSSQTNLSEEKFRKLQKEMESDASQITALQKKSGAQGQTRENSNTPPPRSLPSLALQILMGLLFVLFLAVVTIRVLKRLQGRMLAKPGQAGKASGEFFEVLETCHLGPHQKVVALRMNEEVGILGVTPQGIALLNILKEPASEVRQAYARANNSQAFSENLNKILDRFKKPKKVSDLLDEVQR